ncbi:MAG: anti-sigma factor [Hyphomicrobiales bacterium]|nr:anti-sigma factor [Hyphomicrobiales bacterium]MBV9112969.1 anti-sigma factor [Hyphomicrobiales bacterium]MBV9520863.1 anti-sigma factor [Hyphomicrobiales bacterium]
MTEIPTGRPADSDLVAFLDGELSPAQAQWVEIWLTRDVELRQRLDLLGRGSAAPIQDAFAALLAAAPEAKLKQMLLALPGYRVERTVARTRRSWLWMRSRPRLALLAAGIALFIAGILVDRFLVDWGGITGIEIARDSEDEWRQAVAQYMSLYTSDTLSGIADEVPPKDRELAAVGAKLGVHLLPSSVSLPGIALKRAQVLQYDGKPLGQIAYLDPRDGVVALCIYTDSHQEIAPSPEQRAGLNIVHWASHGRAFMLVGRKAMPELRELASLLSQRLTL